MKVWVVWDNGRHENPFIYSVWDNEESAKAEAEENECLCTERELNAKE